MCGFWMQNSDFMTRTIACVYGFQTSPVDFLHAKQMCLASELLVSMDPSPPL